MTIAVRQANLGTLSARAAVPGYDRSRITGGIFHFGVGNFHRAHQAVYLDALMNRGRGFEYGIVGSGVREADKAMREALAAQDWLTTVVEQEAGHSAARITGAMIDFVEPGDGAAIIERLTDPEIRIVSLTVTEGGYYIDPASQQFNPDHPDIVADARNDAPKTAFGLIAAGLAARRAAGVSPFTVMSCDNLPHNGKVTRDAVVGLARLKDRDLADWIAGEIAFPNGMVDRITPATGDRERGLLAEEFGISDRWPVFCETFKQWVLEDNFPLGRPALEEVGVQFVPDVSPYELMKIRILNGGHATIAYPAGLLGIEFVHEAMEEPLVRDFLTRIETDEIIPVVPPVPDTSLDAYHAEIQQRFANPKIGDTVRRLALDGSNRQPKFILPSVADRLAKGLPIDGLALVGALWCRYCYGTDETGAEIAPNDPAWERLTATAKQARTDPDAWLGMADIHGETGRNPVYREAFHKALNALWRDGTRTTLTRYITGSPGA
jgi:mannitol 2-dehydrogenase